MKRVFALTLGCRVNQAETDDFLAGLDVARVPANEEADLVLVNTCSVTMEADKQSRQLVRRALKRGCPVLVTGCSSALSPEAFGELGALVVPKERAKETLRTLLGAGEAPLHEGRTRGFLHLTEGCTNRCTYCIVPAARGPEKHRPLPDLIQAVARFEGLKEVVLTGTRLGTFPALPEFVDRLIREFPGIQRWRLASLEPMDLSDPLIEVFERPEVCPHLHLPLQSGSDRVLQRMNRRYSVAEYRRIVERLKEIPRFTLSTDLIVGFPGETEEDFRESLDLLEEIGFAGVHVFPFSPRPGTPAASWEAVPSSIVRHRLEQVLEAAKQRRDQWLQSWAGEEVEVLVERVTDPLQRTGLTQHYLRVRFSGNAQQGDLVRVLAEEPDGDGMMGRVI